MTPADEPDSPPPPDPARNRRRAEVAAAWAAAVGRTTYVPMSAAEMQQYLLELVHRMGDALRAEPFDAKPAVEIGRQLVRDDFTGEESLQVTVEVLGEALLVDPAPTPADDRERAERVVALLSGLATGYANGMRMRTLEQQEHIKQALLKSKREAEHREREARARFEEIFDSAAVGIALTDLDGTCVQVNPALADILEYTARELTGRSIYELFADGDADEARTTYLEVAQGVVPRARHRRRMLRSDGTGALVACIVSVLRDGNGRPTHHVTMVADLSELQALQNQLGQQSVRDQLTGLSNRQHLESKVDAMLESATDESSHTLVYLGLDAFSVINSGYGLEMGDWVLQSVANKLRALVADQDATVARLGGDEFGILIANTPDTPDIQNLISELNMELAEPIWRDDVGVAVCASIGVFRHDGRFPRGADPIRAANSTMRRAKANGKRQWELYDPRIDADEKARSAVVGAMPGAWENGELDIEYEPLVRLAPPSDAVAGVEVLLRWNRADGEVIGDERCREMADRTGMSLTIGPWAFERACVQAADRLPRLDRAGQRPAVLRLRLTALQSSDGDLAAMVNRVVAQSGLPVHRIEVALDTRALLTGQATAVALDNFNTLTDIGVHTALHEFTGGYREFALLEELGVGSVILAPDHTAERRGGVVGGSDSVLATITTDMVRALHRRGTLVSVLGVATWQDALWWREVGVDFAQGAFAGRPGPAGEVLAEAVPAEAVPAKAMSTDEMSAHGLSADEREPSGSAVNGLR